jgi:hypothetical protein
LVCREIVDDRAADRIGGVNERSGRSLGSPDVEVDMFDADAFVAECQTALGASQPMLTIKEILDRAVSEPDTVATALHAEPGAAVLRRSVDVDVVSVLIPPVRPSRCRTISNVGAGRHLWRTGG